MNQRLVCMVLASMAQAAMAQESAQVLSAVPVLQQVAVPQQVCRTEQQLVQRENTGSGALLGTVAGGVAGNAFGSGEGRALATLFGVVLGALWGDRLEGQPAPQAQQVRQCVLQSVLQHQVVGYDVRYQYAGLQYRVQWPHDPGPQLAVVVMPSGAVPIRADTPLGGNGWTGP